ncbi:hypothetical protein FRB96_006439 [Tulasnella sp. 330]|nr:hypothetical protein FRB96_006439 [Tulasnella sp. 330]KAG8878287.1 hypothetical protein FRB97_002637 [Tulasnella sp. 331]KAG8883736.1 hypothetical protein FRB98_002834 [Tulasnella sp. 332]
MSDTSAEQADLYDSSQAPWRALSIASNQTAVSLTPDYCVEQRQEISSEESTVKSVPSSPRRPTRGSLVHRRRKKNRVNHYGKKISASEIRMAQENRVMLMVRRQQETIMLAGPMCGGPLTIWRDGTNAKIVDSAARWVGLAM